VNRLTTDQVITRKTLLVPKSPNARLPEPEDIANLEESQRKLRCQKEFRKATGCGTEETTFYLEDCEYNLEEAIGAWKGDREWETADRRKKIENVIHQREHINDPNDVCCFAPN